MPRRARDRSRSRGRCSLSRRPVRTARPRWSPRRIASPRTRRRGAAAAPRAARGRAGGSRARRRFARPRWRRAARAAGCAALRGPARASGRCRGRRRRTPARSRPRAPPASAARPRPTAAPRSARVRRSSRHAREAGARPAPRAPRRRGRGRTAQRLPQHADAVGLAQVADDAPDRRRHRRDGRDDLDDAVASRAGAPVHAPSMPVADVACCFAAGCAAARSSCCSRRSRTSWSDSRDTSSRAVSGVSGSGSFAGAGAASFAEGNAACNATRAMHATTSAGRRRRGSRGSHAIPRGNAGHHGPARSRPVNPGRTMHGRRIAVGPQRHRSASRRP